MIDPKELRIGNIVQFLYPEEDAGGNMIGCRDELTLTAKDIYHAVDYPEMYDPIPLTPEILEKCGFEITIEGDVDPDYGPKDWTKEYAAEYSVLPLYITLWPNEGGANGDYLLDNYSSAPLKYLHQIQNLYYCLTGQELEVKL